MSSICKYSKEHRLSIRDGVRRMEGVEVGVRRVRPGFNTILL
jgi:hypothetical protein